MSEPYTVEPNKSLPPRLQAGDARSWSVTTNLPVGTVLFYVLSASIANTPTRFTLGGNGANITTMDDPSPVFSGTAVDATGAAAFTVASTDSAAWQPGKYTWVLFAIDASGNRTQLASGEMRVSPDPNGANPVDPRSPNEKLLEQIQCLLQNKAMDDVQMYKIGTRELTKMPVFDLMKWEGIIAARVRRERRRKGQFTGTQTVGIKFGGR